MLLRMEGDANLRPASIIIILAEGDKRLKYRINSSGTGEDIVPQKWKTINGGRVRGKGRSQRHQRGSKSRGLEN